MNKQTDDENIHIREVLEENRRLKKEQEAIQKTTLFDCIQQGVALKGKYENLKQEYGELLKENEALKRADTIADLESQIMHLRNEYRKLKHRHGLLHDECLELEIKNDDLKQWQKEVFEVIDEKIKHYEHKPFSAPIGQPMSVNFDADMDRIARLSELQCLKKELKE